MFKSILKSLMYYMFPYSNFTMKANENIFQLRPVYTIIIIHNYYCLVHKQALAFI